MFRSLFSHSVLRVSLFIAVLSSTAPWVSAATIATKVTIQDRQILVNDVPFQMKGVTYTPTPIGDDPNIRHHQGDYYTLSYKAQYRKDLKHLRSLGSNIVRLRSWQYDADHKDFLNAAYNRGNKPIYVMASYWLDPKRDITDLKERQAIIAEFRHMVAAHKQHPAILAWIIGEELNAPWMFDNRKELYTLVDEMAKTAHEEEGDHYHPVVMPLGNYSLWENIQHYETSMRHVDVWGLQLATYGPTFRDLFERYAAVSKRPMIITSYGIDAYDDQNGDEYENISDPDQAMFTELLWTEMDEHRDICAGGFVRDYTDQWWAGKTGKNDDGEHPQCPESDAHQQNTCGHLDRGQPDSYDNHEWAGIMRYIVAPDGKATLQPRFVCKTLKALWVGE